QVEAMLPGVGVEVGLGDEAVPERRLRRARTLAQAFRVDGNLPPLNHAEAASRYGFGNDVARPGVPREERRDGEFAAEKAVGDLDEQPGAVAALAVGVKAA